ncbi:MAG: TonB-dependent receptor domain-containing protein [Gemmatimonadota bacterium]
MLREWLKGARRSSLVAVGLAAFVVGPLHAQQTNGKVQGRVTDAATGAPIVGAQVSVEGSTLGNLTNDQGFYFINEVPAGLVSVQAQFIGYRSVVIENERILAGQTTTLNFSLEQTAVELEAITVEGERNPLVPRDQTASKAIVSGETVDQLPLDNASSIVVLQPGVVATNSGITIRGGRPNEQAVFIDGVLVRSFGTGAAQNVNVPTNALEQVDVTVGAFSAEFGDGQSGVVSFVTKRGGPRFTGSLEAMTDQLAPDSWRTNFNRLEGTLGGPISGPLTFFLAGTAQGQAASINDKTPTFFVMDGVDTCPSAPQFASICTAGQPAIFTLPRTSNAPGATDSVQVAAPAFVPFDNGRVFPFNWSDQYLFTGNLNYQLPRGSRINFAYTRNRNQSYGQGGGIGSLFRTDNFDGSLNTQNVFTLGAFFVVTQSANQQLALDLRGSFQTDRLKSGALSPQWFQDHRDPFLNFSSSDVEFLVNPESFRPLGIDVFDPGDELINLVRSNGQPPDSLQVFPSRNDLNASQSLGGLSDNLRANPWAWRTNFSINGPGGAGLTVRDEDRLQLRGTIDWQIGRFNRLKAGAEYLDVDVSSTNIPLFQGTTIPEGAEPIRVGGFLQNRLDIGDLVLEGGVRVDYLDPKVEYPRTPGFVFNVPDSLQAGFTRFDVNTRQIVPKFSTPCGGVSPTNPNGTCLNNFVEAQTKTEWSPRLGASFPVTPTSTFRLSYGRFVQTPAFFTGAAVGTLGFLRNTNRDILLFNPNLTFARDVDLPSTRTFEFGYRQLIGQDLVIDIAAFNKKQRDGLTFRRLSFDDPTIPGKSVFLNVMTNASFTESNGFEVKIDKAIGNLFQGNVSYSFLDAKGTGSDPFTFTALVLRGTSNIAAITNQPQNPPEVLLPLEQSRRHNISMTSSLLFPKDFLEGTPAGAILQDLGVFAILRVRSGLPFTKLINQASGQVGPPSRAGLTGTAETSLSSLQTPWTTSFDVRFTKGFDIGNINAQVFADWRNPFDIANTSRVFLETGNEVNDLFRQATLQNALGDSRLDGDATIDDFDIAQESAENTFNTFMLMRAEQRFGNGDGIFTVEEQDFAFGRVYETSFGKDQFKTSNQVLRLGLRLSF